MPTGMVAVTDFAAVEQHHDVRVAEAGEEVVLVAESCSEVVVAGEGTVEDLECLLSREGGVLDQEHLAHPARAEPAYDAVPGDLGAISTVIGDRPTTSGCRDSGIAGFQRRLRVIRAYDPVRNGRGMRGAHDVQPGKPSLTWGFMGYAPRASLRGRTIASAEPAQSPPRAAARPRRAAATPAAPSAVWSQRRWATSSR